MKRNAELKMTDSLKFRVIRKADREFPAAITLLNVLRFGLPRFGLLASVNEWRVRNLPYLLRDMWKVFLAKWLKMPHHVGTIYGQIIRADGTIEILGLMSFQLVTTAGVNYIAARMANTSPSNISLFNFHALGTGTNAPTNGDTTLQTEWSSSNYTGSIRPTGTQSNPSANVYQSVATNTMAAAGPSAVTEWGLFTQSGLGGGTMLDRMTFAAVNLSNGDQFATTFQLTLAAGG